MPAEQVLALMFALAFILVLTQLLGALARRLRQPAVIGEIIAGIVVGPMMFHGAIANTLIPQVVRPQLSGLANIGLALFMFMVGMELDRNPLRGKGRTAVSVSFAAMLLPFGLGCLLALHLADGHSPAHRLSFVLFLGTAMSVTAFPVLARILADHKMLRTPLGDLSLSCAAMADVLAWTMLAIVVAMTGGNGRPPWLVTLAVPYVFAIFLLVRPLVRRWSRSPDGDGTHRILLIAVVGLLISGALTEWMGLHFIFGAFLFGVIMPKDGTESSQIMFRERAQWLSNVLLLPVYFVIAGLQVDLSGVGSVGVGDLALIILVAIGGKFFGTFLAARAGKVERRQATALAVLMNTRGLTELVILTVGLQLGVLDRALYSLMVVMALVTTAMTSPLLSLLHPPARFHDDLFGIEPNVSSARVTD